MRQDYAELPNFSSQPAAILSTADKSANKLEKSHKSRRQSQQTNFRNPPGRGDKSDIQIWKILLQEGQVSCLSWEFDKYRWVICFCWNRICAQSTVFFFQRKFPTAPKFSIHIWIISAWPKIEGLQGLTIPPKNVCAGVKTERSHFSKRELPLRL